MGGILNKLTGGDRRSVGAAAEVAAEVLRNEGLMEELFAGLLFDDPILRSRTAHALMQVAGQRPDLVQPYKDRILEEVAPLEQWEVREQICKILPALALSPTDIDRVLRLFQAYLEDRHSIVKTCAMQGMADLTRHDPALTPEIRFLIENLSMNGTAAMRARGRKLLKSLSS